MEHAGVASILEAELAALGEFQNFHGITKTNIRSLLVEPYRVLVDPDDLETEPREMWAFLQERSDEGYILAFDPLLGSWSVVERTGGKAYVQVISSTSLAGALNGM
jgi:hypothetical protein